MTQIYTRPFISAMHERHSSYDQQNISDHSATRNPQKMDTYSRSHRPFEGTTREACAPISEHQKVHCVAPFQEAEEMCPKRPELNQNAPREQLPPLSSLFGSSSYESRPALSPYSDHQSPVFPDVSPKDVRQSVTTFRPERSYDSSYVQSQATARQYYYHSRPEPCERLGFPATPRPVQAAARPNSPQYESQYASTGIPRSQPSSAWSPPSTVSAGEYFPRDLSSFRHVSEYRDQPPQLYRPEQQSRQTLRDLTHDPIMTPTYPPTPGSTVVGELSNSKDGLGPKIWTGTQFLPRFVRQAEVLGEGMCYFYDDGTHCKTLIDGEVVNAHWGVTKAGKPRKRLAIACITCREKKIKCDPDYPRCVQCEKFGRVCKFKNAPRGSHGSPQTPPVDPEELIPRPISARTDSDSFQPDRHGNSPSLSPRQLLRRATPDSDIHPSKRQRTGYANFNPLPSEASSRLSIQEPISASDAWQKAVNSPIDHSVLRDWQVNPYTTHPALVRDLMTAFFKNAPETAYCIFPETPFTAWVLSGAEKSLDDLMLIYTILAFSTVFSSKPEHKSLGIQYASIARYTCDNRHFSLQLVQARLILALYYFAINNANDSWDACGGAIRAASGLRLNLEFEKSGEAYLKSFPYGLNRHGYAECRRRTFWCCYLLDRFNGFSSGHFSIIHPEDIFLRLPCDANSYETQCEVQNPYFEPTTPFIQNDLWTIGSMAYLINICTIWGEVMANIYRTTQRPVPAKSISTFTKFYETTTKRLRAWKDSLPAGYRFSAESLQSATNSGNLGTFMTMHTVYHVAAMKLNRYIQHFSLSSSQVAHHISVAQQHAETVLAIMDTLAARRISSANPTHPGEMSTAVNKFSSPFVGYSIISAIDILTTRVSVLALPDRLSSFAGAQSILTELALYWQSSRIQQTLVSQRVRDLAQLGRRYDEQGRARAITVQDGHMSGVATEVREGVFQMREPLEKTFSRDCDCIYS